MALVFKPFLFPEPEQKSFDAGCQAIKSESDTTRHQLPEHQRLEVVASPLELLGFLQDTAEQNHLRVSCNRATYSHTAGYRDGKHEHLTR